MYRTYGGRDKSKWLELCEQAAAVEQPDVVEEQPAEVTDPEPPQKAKTQPRMQAPAPEPTLNDDFFKALDGSQLEHGALHVSVSIRKTSGFFELLLHTEGTVTVTCDR